MENEIRQKRKWNLKKSVHEVHRFLNLNSLVWPWPWTKTNEQFKGSIFKFLDEMNPQFLMLLALTDSNGALFIPQGTLNT